MNRLIPTLITLFLLSACGAKDETPVYPDRTVSLPSNGKTQTVSGSCKFIGIPPPPRDIGMCQGTGTPVSDQSIRVQDEQLQDVLIYVKQGLEGFTFPYNKEEAVIDQKGCVFEPHVLAVQTYQPIRIKNSDAVIHNVNFGSRLPGQGFVTTITPSQGSIVHQVRQSETNISVTCDVHAYMLMYVHAIPHPFFATTGSDGTYSIENLPKGNYVIEAIHPQLGKQSKRITIDDEAPKPLIFEFRR